MPLVKATCTNCNANLEVDSTKDAAICPYCGTAYIVDRAVNNYNTHNDIHADVVNLYGGRTTANDLFEKAQTYVKLDEIRNAGLTLRQMLEEYPADARASKLYIELWLAECINESFLRFNNKVGQLNESLWKRAVILNGNSIIQMSEATLNPLCERIRKGDVLADLQTIPQWFNVPCVVNLIAESKRNAFEWNHRIGELLKENNLYLGAHPETNMYQRMKNVHVCFRRWFFVDKMYNGYDEVWFAEFIIGRAFWYKKNGTNVAKQLRYPFSIDFLNWTFKGMRDDLNAGICPYCGKGKQKVMSKKCSNCGSEYEVMQIKETFFDRLNNR